MLFEFDSRSRIHERTVSLRLLCLILRVLRLEVSVYNVWNSKPVSKHFCSRGGVNPFVEVIEVTVNSKEENS